MTYTGQFPTASGMALTISGNVRTILDSRGHNLDWLAAQCDIEVHTLLTHFTAGVPAWLSLDIADVLGVSFDQLVGEPVVVPEPTDHYEEERARILTAFGHDIGPATDWDAA